MNAERSGDGDITVNEAATQLHLTARRVRQLLKEEKLRGKHLGRKWLIPRSAVDRFKAVSEGMAVLPTTSQATSGTVIAEETEARKLPTDPELGPHARELFYFGQRFRDLLSVPVPYEVVAMTRGEYEGAMWEGSLSGGLATPPHDAEEEAVAREWGSGRRDARTYALFPAFRQHMLSHECWESLDHVESGYNEYGQACRQGYEAVVDVVSKRIRGTSSNAADGHADAIARSLLADGLHRKRTGRNLAEPQKEQEADGWLLHLGSQFCRVNSPTEADALAKTYQELRESLLHNSELSAIAKAQEQVEKAVADFQASLPNPLLRKLVLNGRCEWCP